MTVCGRAGAVGWAPPAQVFRPAAGVWQKSRTSPVFPTVFWSAEEQVGAYTRNQERGDPEHRLLVPAHPRFCGADLQGTHQRHGLLPCGGTEALRDASFVLVERF